MTILVSACLLGVNCRYNGTGGLREELLKLMTAHSLIPICPEQLGGLPTPRPPAECRSGRVITDEGNDVTTAFQTGACEALKLARLYSCHYAILKERSPSCGSGRIYDGTFSGALTYGDGITAALLKSHGIRVFGESEISDLKRLL